MNGFKSNITMKNKLILLIVSLLFLPSLNAQVRLVHKGKSKSRIVLTENTNEEKVAASILQTFIERISGYSLPIVENKKASKGDVILGHSTSESVSEDGFIAFTNDGILEIYGKNSGVIYGAITILENYLGVDYWGENEYSLTKNNTIELPFIMHKSNPAFRYRQTQFYGIKNDPTYKWWHRLEEPAEMFAAGYWVHTFDKLLPSAVYGKTNPEYYAYYNGKRNPGKASQWCLTNPEVLEIVSQRIDSIFKANPGMNIISVSQNDGNYTNCTCPACKAIDDREEALSGSLITFLNKLAERFPDKEFSTLAYLYTMKPPKYIKPLPNVNIMLCDIDAKREVSLTENASGQEFVKAMEGWSRITNNIFVWDYGINFDNYLSPFPNFHILQDNIQLFAKNNATMHFSQIAGSRGGDFAELRAYLVSKLMWNPYIDLDKTMKHFLNGYYGKAAPFIYQYIKIMEGALIASGVDLWIYDSPVTHKNGMLKPALMRRYNKLFDDAEAAVKHEDTLRKRVQRARLPLLYSELEIIRTEKDKDIDELNAKLSLFEERVKEFDVPTLNERTNSPLEYAQQYRERYMPKAEKSIALGAQVNYLIQPTGKYAELGKSALTDGLFGGSTFVESWVGWEGTDAHFIVDMGEVKDIHSIEVDFLHQLGQWILFPLEVTYSYSSDGTNFTFWDKHDLGEDQSVAVKFQGVKTVSQKPIRTRYVKVEVVATKECPHWHYGVGHPSWVFIDEVTIH